MEFHDRPTSANLATSRVVSSFGGKHVYDGVFSGSPSVKAKNAGMDDYGEIFRGSGGSIPVLDVAELKDRNFSPADAVRTSKIDYSKIFGGFGDDPDIGVPYEELVAKPKKPRKKSSPEIRVAARSESIGSQQVPSAEVASEPVDGVKQVNVLYNKTNPGCMNGASGTTHIAQLHAIPGYTRLIDDISPSDMTQGGKPVRSALHEAHLNSNVDPRMAQGKPPKKAVSGPLPVVGFQSMSGKDTAIRRKSSRSGSISGHMSFDEFEIGQGMNSSSPPNLSNNGNAGFFNSPIVMKVGASKSDVSEGADGSYSPPSFYEEIDANSAAAASAAAVRKAIEEAQVKIKFARDLMERKKEGLQNGLKPSFYNGLRNQKKEVKSAVSANRPEQEKAQKSSRKEDALKQASPGLTDYNARTPTQSTPHLGYQKKSIASNNIEEVRRTESTSGHAGDRLKEPVNEKAAAPIIENVGPVEDRSTKLEAEREDKAPALAFKWAGSVKEMAPFVDENGYREKMAPEESMKKAKEFSKESPAVEEAPPPTHEKVVRGQNLVERTFEFDTCAENIMLAQPEEAYNIMLAQPEEADNKPIVSCEVANCGSTLKIAQELEEIVDVQAQELKEKNYMMEQKEAEDCVEINTKQSEVCSQEEMDDVPHDQAREEMERKLDDIHGEEGNKEDWVECDEELEEDCQQENNENRENDFFVKVTQSKSGDVVTLDDPQDQEETEKSSRGECAQEVNEISMTQADTFEQVDTEVTQLEIEQTEEDKNLETAQQDLINQKNNCEPADDIYKQDETKNLDGSEEACRKENFEGVEVSPEGHSQNGRIMEVNEGFPVTEDIEKASKPSEDANVLEEEEDPETVRISQDHVELGTSKNQAVNITKTALMNENEAFSGETVCNFENEQNIFDVTKHKKPGGQENHTEEVSSGSDDIDENINESEIVTTSKDTVINYASSYEERWSDSGTRRRWDFKNCVRDVVCKLEENDEDMNQSEDNTDHEDDDYFESSSEERWIDTNGFDVETSQPCAFDGEGNTMESPKEEEADHSMDKNYEHQRALEEREAEDTSKREADVENELHIRREEAKEKEMEREKERIAVERAIREARERAFADARARAEKAAVERASSEAHQRLRAETQDRSGKASAENRERLEKASAGANKATEKVQEAKLRAERAAVERVTAEARKRALEKAVSETAASKARSKSEKFAAEKSTGAPKDGGISSSHYKGPCSSSSSRHPSSSNHAVSRSTERYNGASGELQRSKVSSEKDQRMAERAAKALAEKNTRELLAQKEQAERNRLAETLDAEVRRWSSGKERNLRALLSTLQYILGPDSGWQPIPLTELIPATAVKKAYRKATLFVHPDKLQQRGASTQQKYTCEKVFDLLKDAWNRYSAEER